MGAWGTGLFADDTESDVREDFRTHIGDGLTAEQATATLLDEWGSTIEDRDEAPAFWLTLASTQWSLGRLLPNSGTRMQGLIREAYAPFAQHTFTAFAQPTAVTTASDVAEAVWRAAHTSDQLRFAAGADAIALVHSM